MLKKFDNLLEVLKNEKNKKVAVAMAQDADVLIALEKARTAGLADAILVGSAKELGNIAGRINLDLGAYEIIDIQDELECVKEAVKLVKSGEAQVLMKGLCSTSNFLKGILDKENGLRTGKVLSHLAIFESKNYHKLLFLSDAAMNISPNLNDKIAITENSIKAALALGYENPKVAIISAVEKVNAEAMPSTADAAIISKMGDRKQIKNAIIDGPLALDNALSARANEVKGLESPVGGDADICIVPNIEAGNIFYKLLTTIGDAKVAGVILGAAAPVVLTSRADSDESKFLSIVSALAIS
ncbi:MAG: bifunctional enoyl-CoA hydratase/phosphate acetyltransferase [Calditrichaceae bacterium]